MLIALQNYHHFLTVVPSRGFIVPQETYVSESPSYAQCATIFFDEGGLPGVSLARALPSGFYRGGHCTLSNAAERPHISATGLRTILRILVRCYSTLSSCSDFVLAFTVARLSCMVSSHYCEGAESRLRRHTHHQSKARPRHSQSCLEFLFCSFEDLLLVQLLHVSTGSWQPVLIWKPSGAYPASR